jgi:hypothetical protein
MFKEFRNHINIVTAIAAWVLAWFITPLLSNGYCNPRLYRDDDYFEFIETATPYCKFYGNVFESFFAFGDNNFLDLFLYGLVFYFFACVIEIILTLVDFIQTKLTKNIVVIERRRKSLKKSHERNDLLMVLRIFGLIPVIISYWFVGGV